MTHTYTIEYLPLSAVHPNEKNPRLIRDAAFRRLVKSLQESPDLFNARPLICSNRTGRLIILGGNMRYLAAKDLKYAEVPVIVMKGLTEDQEKAITIKDNGAFGEWDFSALAGGWSDLTLTDWGVELPKNWLSSTTGPVTEDDFDAQGEAGKITEPSTKSGDIWLLGKHRLMCGDLRESENIRRLRGARSTDLLLTDPPYGINIVRKIDQKTGKGKIGAGGKEYAPIVGDETTDAAREIYRMSQNDGIKNVILWGGNYFTAFLPASPCWIVWDKRGDASSNNFADCEIAWTSFKSPARIYRQVWNGYSREEKRRVEGRIRVHPTQKPVGLFAFCIEKFSDAGGMIFDPCLGSGSALIAAEQLDRICYGMEIDPIYCDVICKRWEAFTGKKAILEGREG